MLLSSFLMKQAESLLNMKCSFVKKVMKRSGRKVITMTVFGVCSLVYVMIYLNVTSGKNNFCAFTLISSFTKKSIF